MAMKIVCNCGAVAEVRESAKHKALSYRCPNCGPVNGRAKGHQEFIRARQFDDSEKNLIPKLDINLIPPVRLPRVNHFSTAGGRSCEH